MRIGIDIRSLQNDSRNRGIGTYARYLVKNILSLDKDNEYIFFAFANRPLPPILSDYNLRKVKIKRVTSLRKRFVWLTGQALLPQAIAKEKLDIFHSLEHIVAVFSQAKKVITVHDFINREFEVYKKRNDWLRKLYFYLIDETMKRADKIVAISEYTKRKIVELLKVEDDKIKVIYEAADKIFHPLSDQKYFSALRVKYNIHRDFLLYVGAIDHHKNIDGLIKAFSRIKFKDINLVLVGVECDVKYTKLIHKLIQDNRLSDKVCILGHIPQEDLVGLYNMAQAVISVSFYEGFGLPVLEAMACARAVIASGNTSMKEIINDAGILVDPYNNEEITYAIDKLLGNPGLRNDLSQKALKRSLDFSWEKAAKDTIAVYGGLGK